MCLKSSWGLIFILIRILKGTVTVGAKNSIKIELIRLLSASFLFFSNSKWMRRYHWKGEMHLPKLNPRCLTFWTFWFHFLTLRISIFIWWRTDEYEHFESQLNIWDLICLNRTFEVSNIHFWQYSLSHRFLSTWKRYCFNPPDKF